MKQSKTASATNGSAQRDLRTVSDTPSAEVTFDTWWQGQINGNLKRINNSSKAEQTLIKSSADPAAPRHGGQSRSNTPAARHRGQSPVSWLALLLRFALCATLCKSSTSGNFAALLRNIPSLRMTHRGMRGISAPAVRSFLPFPKVFPFSHLTFCIF